MFLVSRTCVLNIQHRCGYCSWLIQVTIPVSLVHVFTSSSITLVERPTTSLYLLVWGFLFKTHFCVHSRRGSNLLQIMLPERVHRLKNFQICFFGQVTNSVSFYWLTNFFNNFFLRGSNLKTLFVKFFFELILIIWECM